MAVGDYPLIFKNARVFLTSASEDLSPYLTEVRLTQEFDEHDVTTMGQTSHAYVPGLGKWALEMQALQDFRSTGVVPIDKRMWALLGNPNGVSVGIRPEYAERSSDNPEYQGIITLFSHNPLDGAIGEPLKTRLSFRGKGSLTRVATSSG